jgi:hypothetical protein
VPNSCLALSSYFLPPQRRDAVSREARCMGRGISSRRAAIIEHVLYTIIDTITMSSLHLSHYLLSRAGRCFAPPYFPAPVLQDLYRRRTNREHSRILTSLPYRHLPLHRAIPAVQSPLLPKVDTVRIKYPRLNRPSSNRWPR